MRRPTLGSSLAIALVLLGGSGFLLGAAPPLGHQAWMSLHSWWTLQRFHQAVDDQDHLAMLELGRSYLSQTGRGEILEFACYRVGYGASGPSNNRLPEDALYWAQTGLQPLLNLAEVLPNPWPSLRTQSYILVERVFPQTLDAADLQGAIGATQDLLASGGGLDPLSGSARKAYRNYLQTPKEGRNAFILQYLSPANGIQGSAEDVTPR
jgi:hypothetical protein